MSSYNARKKTALKQGLSYSKLLSTSALTAASLFALGGSAYADNAWVLNQVGGSFDTDTSVDNITNINQNTSRAIGEGNLDIESYQTVNITQKSASDLFVARDNRADPTRILGKLNANGRVMVIDVNGVFFGSDSVVNVGGIIASTADIANANIMSGSNNFEFTDFGDGQIVLEGQINVAEAGLAAFVSPFVTNAGVINAKLGTVAFAAGETVTLDMYGDGLVEIAVDGDLADALLGNTGEIKAEGGTVQMTAKAAKEAVDNIINVEGLVTVASAEMQGGKIVLSGGNSGKVTVDGTLDASGTTGGDVDIDGEAVELTEDSLIAASATEDSGQAGRIVAWADSSLFSIGRLVAEGQNGFIETSTEGGGLIDNLVTLGEGGHYLIDPTNVCITGGSACTIGGALAVTTASIEAALLGALGITYEVTTDIGGVDAGDMEVVDSITTATGTLSTLKLTANDDLEFKAGTGITDTGGGLNIELTADVDNDSADSDIIIRAGADFFTNGGDFTARTSDDIIIRSEINTADTAGVQAGNINLISDDNGIGGDGGSRLLLGTNAKLVTTDNATNGGLEGDVTIETDRFDMLAGAEIDAADGGTTDGTVSIDRDTAGSIGLGAGAGDTSISQDEIAAIDAENLVIGGSNTSEINVEDVNTTTATISNLVTLNTSNLTGLDDHVNFAGENVFNALTVNSDDDINFADGASVETLSGDATFNGDTNDGSVGNFEMGEGSSVDTNGNKIIVNALDVNLGEDALLGSEGGDINIVADDTFGDGNVNLASGAMIDADGGNIVIDNDAIFFSEDDDSVTTHSGGTIDINQNEGGLIQNAVDAVNNTGDGLNTIHVGAGTYEENIIVIDDNMYLEGANHGVDPNTGIRGPESIIDGGVGLDGEAFAVKNVGDNFTIDGFTLTADGYGVDVGSADGSVEDVTVKNNIITTLNVIDIEDQGIRGLNVLNGFVMNNLLSGVGNDGILFTDSENINITDNVLSMIDFNGIELNNVNGSVISGNTIDSTGVGFGNTEGHGILVTDGTGVNTISGNMIGTNDGPGNIAGDGIQLANTDGATVTGNTIANAAGNGIYNNGSDGTTIGGFGVGEANTITDVAGAGVLINPSFNVDVIGNVISGALQGVKLENSSNITVSGNIISNVTDGVHVTNTGGFLDILGNGIIASAHGVLFTDAVDGASVRINNGNNIVGGQDGIEFNGVSGGSSVEIYNNGLIQGLGGDAIKFKGASPSVSGSTVLITGNTTVTGTSNGIEFSDDVVDSLVKIAGNGTISGTGSSTAGDAIDFRGLVVNSDVDIKENTNITGADDGIQVIGGIRGGTFRVTDNGQITGLDGDGITLLDYSSFGGDDTRSIGDGAVVTISDNSITGTGPDNDANNQGGTGDGVLVSGQVADGSSVTMQRNTITGYDEGVNFNGKITGASTVTISDANTIAGTTGNGIGFAGIDGGSNVTISGNTSITGGEDAINFGPGSPSVDGSTVNITGNATISGGDDGIAFDDEVTNSQVNINNNGVIVGSLTDGIEFNGINNNSTVNIIGNNLINGETDQGILFNGASPSVADSTVTISGNGSIFGVDNGILFTDEVTGSQINIGINNIGGLNDGIRFEEGMSASLLTMGSNVITGQNGDGVLVDGQVNGSAITSVNDKISGSNNGFAINGDISGSVVSMTAHDITATNEDGILVTGATLASVVAIGEGSVNAGQDGVRFGGQVNASTIVIDGNTINATNDDGIEFNGINGSSSVAIGASTITAGDNGVEFNGASPAIEDSTVTIDTNTITGGTDGVHFDEEIKNSTVTISSNDIEGKDDGVDFTGAISNGSTIDVKDNDRIEGLGTAAGEDGLGDGIAFGGAVSGATTNINITGNTLIKGDDRGINFRSSGTGGPATITDASVTISDNDEIRGVNLDGILFNAKITNANITIGGASGADANGLIIGAQDGIDVQNVDGGTFTIANNTKIEGETGDAVEFEGAVNNGAIVKVNDNEDIIGAVDGVVFESTVDNATVEVNNNDNIDAGDDGVAFNGAVTGSNITISGNNHGIHADDHGIVFYSSISGGSTMNIHDNIIGANENNDATGSGIWFGGTINDANINIGDGAFNGFRSGASNIIRVGGNNGGGGVSNLDAIHFDKDVGDGAVIRIDGNRLGYFAWSVGGSLSQRQLADDGIEFKGKVKGDADVLITDNYIRAKDDGIQFSNDIQDDAVVVIGGSDGDNNWINAWDNGISFLDEIKNHSKVEVSYAEIDAGNNGIYFKGNTSNHDHSGDPEEILIKKNKITGGSNGILFEGKASHGLHDIMIRDNFKIRGEDGDGIRHEGDIDDAELTIKHNDEIFGKYDGIDIIGYFTDDAAIRIHGNKDIDTDRDDGISVYQYGGAGGVDLEIDDNHVHWTGDDGIFVHNVRGASIHDNEIHHTGRRSGQDGHGIYVSNSDYADIIDNTLWNIDAHGIFVNPSDNVDINDNQIGGWVSGWGLVKGANWDGIRIQDSDYADIKHNNIYWVGDDGIHVEDSDHAYVHWNEIRKTGDDGIFVEDGSDYATIDMNVLEYIGGNGISVEGGYFNNIDGNYIYKTGGHGIHNDYGYHTTINNNIIEFAKYDGIHSDYGYDTSITNNWIAWSGDDGIDVSHSKYVYIGGKLGNGIDYSADNGIVVHRSYNVDIHNNDIYFAGNDGIHAGGIRDYGNDYYGAYTQYSDGFALKIRGNEVDMVGDDGIEAHDSGRTKIAYNDVHDVGLYGYFYGIPYYGHEYNFHDGEETGGGHYSRKGNDFYFNGGDEYGADGIHARNIEASDRFIPRLQLSGYGEGGDYGYSFNPYEYSLIIKGNHVGRTADDGIEVVGDQYWGYNPYAGKYGREYQYGTGRTLIAYNKVHDAGYVDYFHSYSPYGHYYFYNGSEDGHGADGIHVRGVFDNNRNEEAVSFIAGGGEGGFYGYAVDVLYNKVRRTLDDGIEVRDSESTLIQGNKVRKAGWHTDYGFGHGGDEYKDYDYDYGYGRDADGIHVENVYGTLGIFGPGLETDYGFSPYAVVIDGNKVNRTADDGIEVAYAGRTRISYNRVRNAGYGDSGEGGEGGESYGGGDRFGADGIHVRGITNIFDFYQGDTITTSNAFAGGGYGYGYGYDIEIIGNKVKTTDDDGIEVIAKKRRNDDKNTRSLINGFGGYSTDLLVERNHVTDAGDDGIALVAKHRNRKFAQYDEGYEGDYGYGCKECGYYEGFFNSDIFDNVVENSGTRGLNVDGYGHNNVVLAGNTFIDNPTGARFESGKIDLTNLENPNSFIINDEFVGPVVGMQFELAKPWRPDSLTIVDETLGGTIFSGFINRPVGESWYVRFEDGAILTCEGDVIVIDGQQANWDGIVPANAPFNGVLPGAVLDAIEDRLFDADDPDVDGRGQIFVGLRDDGQTLENIEDFFNQFDPFAGGTTGLNVTLTGLPFITPPPGGLGPAGLAAIEPAAGEEEGGTAPQDIEPEAGGEDAPCWGDAVNAAGSGTFASLNWDGTAEGSIAARSGCTSDSY